MKKLQLLLRIAQELEALSKSLGGLSEEIQQLASMEEQVKVGEALEKSDLGNKAGQAHGKSDPGVKVGQAEEKSDQRVKGEQALEKSDPGGKVGETEEKSKQGPKIQGKAAKKSVDKKPATPATPATKGKKVAAKSAKTSDKVEKPISIEKVRGVLAAKAKEGNEEKVRELIKLFGGEKLTDLDPACYKELLEKAEVI